MSAELSSQIPGAAATNTLRKRLAGIALLLASTALAAYVVANKHAVEELLHIAGPWGVPIAVALFGLVASAPLSIIDGLSVANGVAFGPWTGSLVNIAGLIAGAFGGYAIARRTSHLLEIDKQIAKLPAVVLQYRIGSAPFLLLVRIIPGVGGTLATQIAAALRVPLMRHVATMCAVTVPVAVLLAFGGDALATAFQQHVVAPAERYVERHHPHLPHARTAIPPSQ
jgi:uncharacterized membrane protein YdjX (TVP38/TMEM64 family)